MIINIWENKLEEKINNIKKAIVEVFGTMQKAATAFSSAYNEMDKKWDQDTEKIGKILRAHLFVEHFMTHYLEKVNPNLGDIDNAKLTYLQKLKLIENHSETTRELRNGIKHLNKVRNRIAHSMKADISIDDVNVFLQTDSFRIMREEAAKPNKPNSEPLDVLERFAKHVGTRFYGMLEADSLSKVFGYGGNVRFVKMNGNQSLKIITIAPIVKTRLN